MNQKPKLYVLTAGGTGGHLFPAEALAGELQARGHEIALLTDARGKKFSGALANARIITVPSAALSGRSVVKLAAAPFKIAAGFLSSARHFRALKPGAVIGFGGYPSVPVMLAAVAAGYPTAIVSPDALLGRANRLLMNRVDAIAANFPLVRFLPKHMDRVVYTGNPLRPAVLAISPAPYDAPRGDGPVKLTVFGGSQGARVFSDVVPAALALLPEALRTRIDLVQQCRAEDIDAVRATYAALGIRAELKSFFDDMPAQMARAHLVIARSGAGTVSELGALGRPAILVPLPYALDDNQTPNAEALVSVGGGWRVPQKDFTAENLAVRLQEIFADPAALAARAENARALARLEATKALADLVEHLEKKT